MLFLFNQLFTKTYLWGFLAFAIGAVYVPTAISYRPLWDRPAGFLLVCAKAIWGFLTTSYGAPGWAWLLIALFVLGLLSLLILVIAAVRGSNARSTRIRGPSRNADPTSTEMFGALLRWRFERSNDTRMVMDTSVLCPPCQMELTLDLNSWYCIRCNNRYPQVPHDIHDVTRHIVGWLRRNGL